MKQIINVPDGFKLIQISDNEFKLVPDEHKLPSSWPEFCVLEWEQEYHRMKAPMYALAPDGMVRETCLHTVRHPMKEYNLFRTKEKVYAFRALMMLTHLRDWYNDNWFPNWSDSKQAKYCIVLNNTGWTFATHYGAVAFFAFRTRELALEFLKNFKEPMELLKPLLGYGFKLDTNLQD